MSDKKSSAPLHSASAVSAKISAVSALKKYFNAEDAGVGRRDGRDKASDL